MILISKPIFEIIIQASKVRRDQGFIEITSTVNNEAYSVITPYLRRNEAAHNVKSEPAGLTRQFRFLIKKNPPNVRMMNPGHGAGKGEGTDG